MSPISLRRVTTSREIVLDTTTTPSDKASKRVAQMKVSKKIANAPEVPPEVITEVTSSKALPNRRRNVVVATTVVRDAKTREVLKGRLFRSFEA
jgi:hypothetical protein